MNKPKDKQALFDYLESEAGYYASMMSDFDFEINVRITCRNGEVKITEI